MAGDVTDEFNNRAEESGNFELGASLEINLEQLYFNVETGLEITRLIPDAETLTPRMTIMEGIYFRGICYQRFNYCSYGNRKARTKT